MTAQVHEGWVLARGVRTHYAWAGTSGPCVVLLHGGGPGSSGATGWSMMVGPLADAGFRVLAPDQLSMGMTDARPHAWPVLGHQSLVNHVSDFLDAMCVDDTMLVGNSQGAYVATKLAMDHPERVRKLFLIGSGTISEAMGLSRTGMNAGMQALMDYDYSEAGMRQFLKAIVNHPEQVSEAVIQSRHMAANLPGIRESRRAFDDAVKRRRQNPALSQQFSMKETLPKLAVPARFVWGEDDRFAPAAMGRELEKLLPNIPFTFIEGAGHQVQTDRPDLVNRMVIEWFSDSGAKVAD